MTSRGITYLLELRNVRKLSMHIFLVNSFYDRTRRLCQKQTTHNRKFNRYSKVRNVIPIRVIEGKTI